MEIPKKTVYLRNKDLLAEVIASKKVGQMSNKLATMLQLLCDRYGRKGNFVNYTYNEDMKAYAMLMLCKTWQAFDPAKSNNAFAFFTQCVKNSFIQYLNYEQRHRDIRDVSLINEGMSPSYGYEGDSDDIHLVDDEEDFHNIQHTSKILKKAEVEAILVTEEGIDENDATVEIPIKVNENENLEI